jgi:hypothetical protein
METYTIRPCHGTYRIEAVQANGTHRLVAVHRERKAGRRASVGAKRNEPKWAGRRLSAVAARPQ